MKLVSIKTSRFPNRLYLSFSDGLIIPFFVDDLVKLSLAKNQEINQSKFQAIISACLKYLGKDYALKQIAISPKVEKIIRPKLKIFLKKTLKKYKIDYQDIDEIINETINYLNSRNLLSHQDFVDYFIKKNSKKSARQIKFLLSQFDIDPALINSVELSQDDILKIKKIISRRKNTDKLKLKASLYRHGFSLSDIDRAFDDKADFR